MTTFERRYYAVLAVVVVLVAGWAAADALTTDRAERIKERTERIAQIRTEFGKHVKQGVQWTTDEGVVKLWTPKGESQLSLEFVDTGVVASIVPFEACDSQMECETETDRMCADAGWGGVQETTVDVVTHVDGSKTCSGECEGGCNNHGCPTAFVVCGPLT
jgi:hypothetical protein